MSRLLELHLSNIKPVAEQMGEGAAGKGYPSDELTGLECASLCDDTPCSQVRHQQVEAAQIEVAPEDRPDGFGLGLIEALSPDF